MRGGWGEQETFTWSLGRRACVWVCCGVGGVELTQPSVSDTTPSWAPASLGGCGSEYW